MRMRRGGRRKSSEVDSRAIVSVIGADETKCLRDHWKTISKKEQLAYVDFHMGFF